MKIITKFFLLLIFLVGCSTTAERMEDLVADLPLTERSYLAGKFTVNCFPTRGGKNCMQHFNSVSLQFEKFDDSGETDFISPLKSQVGGMFGGDTVHDIIDPENGELIYYFCMAMPSGEYSFYTFRYTDFAGGGSGYYLDVDDQFDIPFTLEPGKITHIDSVKLTSSEGKSRLFGATVFGPGELYFSELNADEKELAIEKCPEEVHAFPQVSLQLYNQKFDSNLIITDFD